MSQPSAKPYVLSGKLGSALVLLPLAAVSGAILLGVLYAYISVYSPIAGYISVLFVAGFAFALGWVISKAGMAAKCRNLGLLRWSGFLGSLLGLYVSWGAFVYALLARYEEDFPASLFGVLLSPGAIWEIAKGINESGWYSIGSMTPKGGVLWAMWGIEALIIVVGVTFLATSKATESVFCEQCGKWCEENKKHCQLTLTSDPGPLDEVIAGKVEALLAFAPYVDQNTPHLNVDTWHCQTCKMTSALRPQLVSFKAGKDGEVEEETEELTEILSVEASLLEQLEERRFPENLS